MPGDESYTSIEKLVDASCNGRLIICTRVLDRSDRVSIEPWKVILTTADFPLVLSKLQKGLAWNKHRGIQRGPARL